MSLRTTTFILILSIVAIGTWYLTRSNTTFYDTSLSYNPVNQSYYLKQTRILGNDNKGQILYEIQADYAEQIEDGSIEFTDVNIRYLPVSEVPWVITSDFAMIQEGTPKIVLQGYVQIVNSSNENKIQTNYIEFNPDKFIAETEEKVEIRFGSRRVYATGMLASFNDDKIELKSDIRGKIAP
ncbi:MAG: LPS export ABC transporter periplasmic protein LptC [Gammaproteobacteria bacterium]|nr:LPS export ABC transporter periplasmic protein LptC [Gammaproteobacteria bacterium]|tara:strand:- start:14913 stop:15458 length:546 start_codon:yes stop_codon:yes gene_type:complete